MRKKILATMLLILSCDTVLAASPYYVFASYMSIKNTSSQDVTCTCNGGYGQNVTRTLLANSPTVSFSFPTITGSSIGFCGNIEGSVLVINCNCSPGAVLDASNLITFSIAGACGGSTSTSTPCQNNSTATLNTSENPTQAAYTCSPSTTCKIDDGTETNWFCGGQHDYKKCTAHGDLVIQDLKTMHYTLEWKDVIMNLVKGQTMVNKLAKDLLANAGALPSPITLESASYKNNTLEIVAASKVGYTSPFPANATAAQCDAVVDVG
ncbi:MAG: hypothetical protein V4496_04580 [Pseudomonadota bacterium]